MDRPLWQIVLAIALAGAAVQRGRGVPRSRSAIRGLAARSRRSPSRRWRSSRRPWASSPAGAPRCFGAAVLGIGLAASALAALALVGAPAAPFAVGKLAVAVLAGAGLTFVVRKELPPFAKGEPG